MEGAFKVLSFRHTKQASKNVANTTFNKAKKIVLPPETYRAQPQTTNCNFDRFAIVFSLMKLNHLLQNGN